MRNTKAIIRSLLARTAFLVSKDHKKITITQTKGVNRKASILDNIKNIMQN
jgi:hypothetical protein